MAEEDLKVVGRFRWKRPPTVYESFIEEEGIPIVRGLGVYDVRDLTLGPWKRTGGNGAYLELNGVGGKSGLYVLEIPPGGALIPERHMYEEIFWVVEGRGTTEIWTDGNPEKKQIFEWQKSSLFSPPLNSWHRLVNAASSPALLLVATNAPPIMALYRSRRFIFENHFEFDDRYGADTDYFKPADQLDIDPLSGRHVNPGNLVPDTLNCELPLENQRGAGHRYFKWRLSENSFFGFLAEYPPGRYSKAHYHESGPVVVCVRGKGYSITWPREIGIRPWETGQGHLVKRQDYVEGGLVSAAPGGDNWYHAHFGTANGQFRVLAFLGGYPRPYYGAPGDETTWNLDQSKGGNTIEYRDEDPQIRKSYLEALEKEGAKFQMPDEVYR
jgi:quercetin dioxygenase-like cupin family protein